MPIATLLANADTARDEGREHDALALFRAAAEQARDSFEPELEARAELGAAAMLHLAGDEAGARTAYEGAVGRAMEGGSRMLEADAHFGLAMLAFDHGRSKDGHDELLEAMALYREMAEREGRVKMARAVRTYGEHVGVLGDVESARQALRLARAMYMDLDDAVAVEDVERALGLLESYAR